MNLFLGFLSCSINLGGGSERIFLPMFSSKNKSESHSVMSSSLQPHELYSPWNSPGQNTAVGSLSLLGWIFPTQLSNRGLLHYRWILYQLSYQGSPTEHNREPKNKSLDVWSNDFLTKVERPMGRKTVFYNCWKTGYLYAKE